MAPAPDRSRRRRVGLIGAGIACLSAARALVGQGLEVALFDKGRGAGGRASTRRAAPFAFDHGAQYFTAKDARFARAVHEWVDEGVVAPWRGRIVALADGELRPARGSSERFVGVPGMSALARRLEQGLEVAHGVRIGALERLPQGWRVGDERGAELGLFERVVVGLPPPQAAALVGDASPLGALAARVRMRPCHAVLLGLDARWETGFEGAFCEGSALSWIARDSSKPGRPAREAWVLHASPLWSEAHLDLEPARAIDALTAELAALVDMPLPPVVHADHRLWRFALPDPPLALGAPHDAERGLVLAGDAWNGARVEGAWLSGLDAARTILDGL